VFSFDLTIDAMESAAEFIVGIRGKLPTGNSESILSWNTNELQTSRIEQTIY